MKLQDFYYKLYAPLVGRGKIYSFFRYLIRIIANNHLRKYFSRTTTMSNDIAIDTIVSLTTFPARIDYVWIAIESIIRQEVRPEKIILWLSADQFDSVDSLPISIRKQQERGLEIRIVQGDIKSHKKYYYSFKEFPNKRIILIDDDIIYKSDFVKKLIYTYDLFPNERKVVCCYAMHMKYDNECRLLPYNKWVKEYGESCSDDMFFGSGGGIIGMARDFHADLTNINLATLLTPTADDIWLNVMARMAKSTIVKIGHGLFLPVIIKNNSSLYKSNVMELRNDEQLQKILSHYNLDSFWRL